MCALLQSSVLIATLGALAMSQAVADDEKKDPPPKVNGLYDAKVKLDHTTPQGKAYSKDGVDALHRVYKDGTVYIHVYGKGLTANLWPVAVGDTLTDAAGVKWVVKRVSYAKVANDCACVVEKAAP